MESELFYLIVGKDSVCGCVCVEIKISKQHVALYFSTILLFGAALKG